ncbi:MAG: type II toxin-antitoxin system VapC family toxin [Anaerolineales bacterium]|nr:type II toxin-antitoxin system VapC family toxin [Anaerolineales bacterium]
MKNVVDSSGWIEYFVNGVNADAFAKPIRDVENLIVPTICLYEVFKRLLAQLDEDEALKTIGHMFLGAVVELDRFTALNAARLSLEHKLAMADSLILATARTNDALLWTQDEHFKNIENVQYFEK